MKELSLSNSELKALVDDEDYEKAKNFLWQIHFQEQKPCRIVRSLKNCRHQSLTAFIFNDEGALIDHKDRNIFNNQKTNLRYADNTDNVCNREKFKGSYSSKYKGVHWSDFHKKWRGVLWYKKKQYHLGYFETDKEAAIAYNNKAIEIHKEFACLNVI